MYLINPLFISCKHNFTFVHIYTMITTDNFWTNQRLYDLILRLMGFWNLLVNIKSSCLELTTLTQHDHFRFYYILFAQLPFQYAKTSHAKLSLFQASFFSPLRSLFWLSIGFCGQTFFWLYDILLNCFDLRFMNAVSWFFSPSQAISR